MKILKKAEQKNLLVDRNEYTVDVLNALLRRHEIFYLKDFEECYEEVNWLDYKNREYRVFTEKLDRIVVELDEYGSYRTVAYFKEEMFLASGKLFVIL